MKSVELRAPVWEVVAVAIDSAGVAPPVELRGATAETPPKGRALQVALPEAFEVSTFPVACVPSVTVSAFVEIEVVAVRFGTVSAPLIVSPALLTLPEKFAKSVELR